MRKISSLDDVQIVLNDLLNFKGRMENGSGNQRGFQIKNTGEGVDPSDVVTVSQIAEFAKKSDIPTQSNRDHFRTILWSSQFAPVAEDLLPPYSIVNHQLAGTPMAVWVSCLTTGTTAKHKFKFNISTLTFKSSTTQDPDTGEDVTTIENVYTDILSEDLTLINGEYGPKQSSNFISPIPMLGVGTIIVPRINDVSGQTALSIGLVLRRNKKDQLV